MTISKYKLYLRHSLLAMFIMILALAGSSKAYAVNAAEKQVFTFFTDECGFSPAAACGIMGNIKLESNFTPSITGIGSAYGLCQWTDVRISRLRSYCSSHGYNSSTINGQLHFILHELQTTFPKVYSYMKSVPNTAQGAYNAGYYWCAHYEIPASVSAMAPLRGNMARNTYWPAIGAITPYLKMSASGTKIQLNWSGNGSGTIKVMRSTKSSGSYEAIAELPKSAKTYTDKEKKKSTRYYYYISWVDGKGKEIKKSNKVSSAIKRSLKSEDAVIELSKESYNWNGKARKPKITVTYDGNTLKKNTDYTVVYKNNVNAGKASVTITGKGNYTGAVKKTFHIRKAMWNISVKDQTVKLSAKRYTPKWKIKGSAKAKHARKIKYTTDNKKVAKVVGSQLLLKGKGETRVTVTAGKDANHKASKVSFMLTVQ